MKSKAIQSLNMHGQSVWYDNLSRDVLKSGELKSLIDAGVSGLTSNPTIFKQAIADTDNYDSDMQSLSNKGLGVSEICEELMINDVAKAADLLLPIYNATNGDDGYASIEVSPYLARDAKGTVQEALRLWGKLKRPNIMIKIPATAECISAIRDCLAQGLNVNVTLIFSKEVYDNVANAYIEALEIRSKSNQDISKIASVASFFVSRVDSIVEKNFLELVKQGKQTAETWKKYDGKAGIANSKIAYESYENIFTSDRFKKISGARVQRPLWASTGTKNPAFSEIMYVAALAGRDTVNTMPPKTLKAVITANEFGPNLHSELKESKAVISQLISCGIDFAGLLVKLQNEGVDSFSNSFKDLLASIEGKVKKLS